MKMLNRHLPATAACTKKFPHALRGHHLYSSSTATLTDPFDPVELLDYPIRLRAYLRGTYENWEHSIVFIGQAAEDSGGRVFCVAGEGCRVAKDYARLGEWCLVKGNTYTGVDGAIKQERREGFEKEEHTLEVWRWDKEAVNKQLPESKVDK